MNVNGFEIAKVDIKDGSFFSTKDSRGNNIAVFEFGDKCWFYQSNKNPPAYCGELSNVAKRSKAGSAIVEYIQNFS